MRHVLFAEKGQRTLEALPTLQRCSEPNGEKRWAHLVCLSRTRLPHATENGQESNYD
jgi:hypothetical protein